MQVLSGPLFKVHAGDSEFQFEPGGDVVIDKDFRPDVDLREQNSSPLCQIITYLAATKEIPKIQVDEDRHEEF